MFIFWRGFGFVPVVMFLAVAIAVNWKAFFDDGKPLGELNWSPVLLLTGTFTFLLHKSLERASSSTHHEAFLRRVMDRWVGHRHSLYGLGLPIWAVLTFGLGVWTWFTNR